MPIDDCAVAGAHAPGGGSAVGGGGVAANIADIDATGNAPHACRPKHHPPTAGMAAVFDAWAETQNALESELWGKPPDRGDTTPRHEPGTGREQSRNTPLRG